MRIAIVGGTGFAGAAIARAALDVGDQVTVYARGGAELAAPMIVRQLDATDPASAPQIVGAADVVVIALSARGPMLGRVGPTIQRFARDAAGRARLIVIGGFGSMRVSVDGPRVAENPAFPAAARPEAEEMLDVLRWLDREAPSDLDWLYVSPAASFGSLHPGAREGAYIVSGDVVEQQDSHVSGADFADAIVEEIRSHDHSGHISVRAVD